MYLILNFLLQLVHQSSYMLIMSFVLTPKRSRLVSLATYILVNIFLLSLKFGSYDNYLALQTSMWLLQVELFLFPILEFKDSLFRKCLCYSILHFCIFIAEASALSIIESIATYTYALAPDTKEFFLGSLLGFSVQLVLSVTFLLFWKYSEYKKNIKSLATFSVIPLLQLFSNTVFLAPTLLNGTTHTAPLLATCSFLSLTASIVLLYYILRHQEKQSIQAAYQELQELYRMETVYYQELESRHEELSKLRHDYNNQLSTLYILISTGQTEAAKKLADSMRNRMK